MIKLKKASCYLLMLNFLLFSSFGQNSTEKVVGNQNEESQNQRITYTENQEKIRISADNVRLFPEKDLKKGGYHLYVKKLPNINSILLTETTKDPTGKNDSYTYRAEKYNSINGDEKRILDGKILTSDGAKYSLIDSTPEDTDFFGPAFHIYIPPKIIYGYEWTRHGEVEISKGTFINIRSFEKPYGDYTGDYVDNPFMFDFVVKKIKRESKPDKLEEPEVFEEPEIKEEIEAEPIITDNYNPIAGEKFKEIAEDVIYSKGPETIIADIFKVLKDGNFKDNLDVVFAIDATGSMKNDIEKLKTDLLPALQSYFGTDSDARVGLLFYRDYVDNFKYNNLPVRIFQFTSDFESFSRNLNSLVIKGKEGGDIPEAVYEAMFASTEFYKWRDNAVKQIILIGDAEPHPTPRGLGKYSRDFVLDNAKSKGIGIHAILLPQD